MARMNDEEFDELLEQKRSEHGRVRGWNDDDEGAFIIRAPTRKEIREFVDRVESDIDLAHEELVQSIAVYPEDPAAVRDFLEELPEHATVASQVAQDELGLPDREASKHELAPYRDKGKRLFGWVDDELGAIVFRQPKRTALKRFNAERKKGGASLIAAAEAFCKSCRVQPSEPKELEPIFEARPTMAIATAVRLANLVRATGRVAGKA